MQLSHDPAKVSAVFDEANLVSCAGLAPVVALAARAGLEDLVARTVTVPGKNGANASVKVAALVAGMVAGADCIDDMDLLRHGAMPRLFTGLRAATTLGAFLRSFTFGHVRQLDAVAARVLAGLARCAPLLPGAHQMTYVDVDDTVRATHGYAKQGSGFGYTGVRGLNVLLGVVSTPLAAPVIAGTRLRKGSANSARGAARLITDTLVTARRLGADPRRGARVLLRADTAFTQVGKTRSVKDAAESRDAGWFARLTQFQSGMKDRVLGGLYRWIADYRAAGGSDDHASGASQEGTPVHRFVARHRFSLPSSGGWMPSIRGTIGGWRPRRSLGSATVRAPGPEGPPRTRRRDPRPRS